MTSTSGVGDGVTKMNLNHAVLFVTDVDRAVDFYTNVLGFEILTREPRMQAAFLTAPGSDNHHDLGLFGGSAPKNPERSAGLYHLAWEVEDVTDMLVLRDRLRDANALSGKSHHGVTISLYGFDPDSNEFEIMWTLPREAWGEYADKGVVMPLDLDAEVARWSETEKANS
ncbi:MAG: VOC family protein [Acidimicrobiia bacterium]